MKKPDREKRIPTKGLTSIKRCTRFPRVNLRTKYYKVINISEGGLKVLTEMKDLGYSFCRGRANVQAKGQQLKFKWKGMVVWQKEAETEPGLYESGICLIKKLELASVS